MKVTHPIKTSEGDEYLVLIESMAMDTYISLNISKAISRICRLYSVIGWFRTLEKIDGYGKNN